jgi:large subunit ribosomal protein L4
MKTAAFFSALSEKIRQNEVVILDKFALDEVKTRRVAETVKALALNGRTLFVLGEYEPDAVKASANIPDVNVQEARLLSVYEVVSTKNLVITIDALKKFEEAVK